MGAIDVEELVRVLCGPQDADCVAEITGLEWSDGSDPAGLVGVVGLDSADIHVIGRFCDDANAARGGRFEVTVSASAAGAVVLRIAGVEAPELSSEQRDDASELVRAWIRGVIRRAADAGVDVVEQQQRLNLRVDGPRRQPPMWQGRGTGRRLLGEE